MKVKNNNIKGKIYLFGLSFEVKTVPLAKVGIQTKKKTPNRIGAYTVFSFFLCLLLSNCTCSGGKNRTDFELFYDMIQQESIKAQEGNEEGTFMRLPPENTRARNKDYYLYKGDPEGAGNNLKNPFEGQFSPELIGIGKRQYERACIYCHGATGAGEGGVAQKMTVKPPSLLADKSVNYSDGRLYHIIREGQGLMGSYRKQVRSEKERWALVNYVRMLQKRATRE